jgi:hypothetical protein
MNKEIQSHKELQQTIEAPENFFRDVEIEFLIHELKDPLAIIETGLRTLLDELCWRGRINPARWLPVTKRHSTER